LWRQGVPDGGLGEVDVAFVNRLGCDAGTNDAPPVTPEHQQIVDEGELRPRPGSRVMCKLEDAG
jgi:hypothetical protein